MMSLERIRTGTRSLLTAIRSTLKLRFRARCLIATLLDPSVRQLDARLQTLAERRGSNTCIIVGNGPSLRHHDLASITGVDFWMCNLAFHGLSELGINPSFWVMADRLAVRKHGHALLSLQRERGFSLLMPLRARFERLTRSDNVYWFRTIKMNPTELSHRDVKNTVQNDPTRVFLTKTVTCVMAHLAMILGYRKIILVGCDAYGLPDEAGRWMPVSEQSPLHFSTKYPSVGELSWYDRHRLSYAHRASYLVLTSLAPFYGTQLINSTAGGSVEVLPRLPLESALRAPLDASPACSILQWSTSGSEELP